VKFISKLQSVVLSETVSLLSPINTVGYPKAAEITREERRHRTLSWHIACFTNKIY
jgi:hypothetical protein